MTNTMSNNDVSKEFRDPLDDSLTYSPLKDLTNKENSPAVFFKSLERARKSPSTARLYALFGGDPSKCEIPPPSPEKYPISPKRLQDFWDTPGKSGLVEPSPVSPEKPGVLSSLSAEVAALRSSLASIQKDCEFHRQRATAAQDQVDHLNKYIGLLEDENKKTRRKISEGRPSVASTEDQEKVQLLQSVETMETLNKSLARQNDLLRSRSSISARFAKKDAKSQTVEPERVSIGTLTAEMAPDSPIMPFMGTPIQPVVTPTAATRRPEPIVEHHITAPSIKFSRIYIRDADTQTDDALSPRRGNFNLPIPSRVSALEPCFIPSSPVESFPLPSEVRRSHGFPFRAAERARRSLPGATSPARSNRKSVPKPLLAAVVRPIKPAPSVPQEDHSPFSWRGEWRTLSSARRGKSLGAVPSHRPKWIP